MTTFRGQPVSEGTAAGEVYQAVPPAGVTHDAQAGEAGAAGVSESPPSDAPAPDAPVPDVAAVQAAFAQVAASRTAFADRLRAVGRDEDADIVMIGALMAGDPALTSPALDATRSGTPAIAAVRDAAAAQAAILEALPDPGLALRAGDVRQVADAVVALLTGAAPPPPPEGPFILVSRDVDPADLIRLGDSGPGGGGPARLVGAVSVGGGASSHAAIIARGLGLPMLTGADPAVLGIPPGRPAIIDAVSGALVLARVDAPPEPPVRGASRPPSPLSTADGELVTVLCNVASAAETRLGLAGGAAGVGLIRTEIPFTRASAWPSREEHLAQLRPILGLLKGQAAVVRLLDFSGDKIPFPGAEGLTALLRAPRALGDQLDAILAVGAGAGLAVMIPMVRSLEEVSHVRGELASAAKRAGTAPPRLGIMVEVAATAAAAHQFAPHVDFFSIGTNDLSADVLGRDRAALLPSSASQRPVLTLIAHVVRVAGQAGIGVSVCGDAAADPAVLPLLIGTGVRTVSVGAARVPRVADWIAGINAAEAAARAAEHLAN